MKRRLLVVLAVFTMLAAVVAAPASGSKSSTPAPWHGHIEGTFYLAECPNEDAPGPVVSWIATVEFGPGVLGLAYFPTSELTDIGDGWVYITEDWTFFKLPRHPTAEKMVAAACDPGRVVMSGVDQAFGAPDGAFYATGEVSTAGRYLEGFIGAEVYWNGIANEDGSEYTGEKWVVPEAAAYGMPVAAERGRLYGEIEGSLYATVCPNDDAPGAFVTWIGEIEFKKWTLGIAYFPASDLVPLSDSGWVYAAEDWTLFKLPKGEPTPEKLLAAACNPHRVVVAGTDAFLGGPDVGVGIGEVTWARPHLDRYVGGTVFWRSDYLSEDGLQYAAEKWIYRADLR